jgi:hypothetical protein
MRRPVVTVSRAVGVSCARWWLAVRQQVLSFQFRELEDHRSVYGCGASRCCAVITLPPMRAARWLARGTRHEECPGSTDAACCCRRRATKSGLEDKSVLHLKQPRGTQNLLTNSIRN